MLNDLDEEAGVQQGVVSAGIEPGGAATEDADVEIAADEVEAVEVGDLKFAARRGLEAAGEGGRLGVVEIEAGDGVVGFWMRGFFLKRKRAAGGVEFDHAVSAGLGYVVGEDGGARGALGGAF